MPNREEERDYHREEKSIEDLAEQESKRAREQEARGE